jgi:hypothetical protein
MTKLDENQSKGEVHKISDERDDVFDAERRTRGTEYASINNRNKCTDRKH